MQELMEGLPRVMFTVISSIHMLPGLLSTFRIFFHFKFSAATTICLVSFRCIIFSLLCLHSFSIYISSIASPSLSCHHHLLYHLNHSVLHPPLHRHPLCSRHLPFSEFSQPSWFYCKAINGSLSTDAA